MKTRLVLLLIGFMLLGLALSVLAAGPDPGSIKTGTAADDIKKLATSEPLAAKLAGVIGHDRVATNFLRRLIGGVCGFLILYTRLGFAFLDTGSRARSVSLPMTMNIVICSIGMLGYQGWLFLTRFFISKREQRAVCYVS
jgi:Amt family ammonium transporter